MKIRLLSLGETVAVAAVVISGLGLYNSWNKADTPAPASVTGGEAKKPSALTLRAEAQADGARLALSPVSTAQVVQSQTIAFPAPLDIAPVETTGDPRIEASWVDAALRKVGEAEKVGAGDLRVPVLITTRYIEDDAEQTDRSVYQLGYVLSEGGLFGGRHVRLRGLSLSARGARDGQKRIDALWTAAHKAAQSPSP
ncbi:hypothetical protein [Sphingomonas quercus]|uniref:Uncharacterized protein n=1 Tax=Sphingomonas quercus TaxID=2842451 RepID=A0ABS6BJW3_9SPHN|nr:hypothetical protein [Sphingomonas quercus]MBU3078583.1 hypothetical protein [Sphingomonas quercus]